MRGSELKKNQNDDSLAKIYMQRRHAEAGMVVAYHLGGRLGHGNVVVGGRVEFWHSRSV